MGDYSIDVKASGPLANGTYRPILQHGTERAEKAVADETADRVRERLGAVLRHPTGRYMAHINVVRRGSGHDVNDRGIVYGPWLEGTGSRNRTTRFKGYATFRRVGQQMERHAARVADRDIGRAARRL